MSVFIQPPFLLPVDIYAFFSEPRIAFCVVPQTEHVPLRAGFPFFMVTRWGSFISVFFLHLTQ